MTMPADHPEAFCERCGSRNPVWTVPSDRFNTAVNRGEVVCPSCFIFAHEDATGMHTVWELVPKTPFRWIGDTGRPTPYLPARVIRPAPTDREMDPVTMSDDEIDAAARKALELGAEMGAQLAAARDARDSAVAALNRVLDIRETQAERYEKVLKKLANHEEDWDGRDCNEVHAIAYAALQDPTEGET